MRASARASTARRALHASLHGGPGEAEEALFVLDLAEMFSRMANAEEREDLRPAHRVQHRIDGREERQRGPSAYSCTDAATTSAYSRRSFRCSRTAAICSRLRPVPNGGLPGSVTGKRFAQPSRAKTLGRLIRGPWTISSSERYGESPPRAPAHEGLTVKEALRTPAFWKMSIAGGLTNLGVIAIVVHQIPFFTSSVGLSEGLAAASVTAMTLLSLLGRLGFAYLADTMDKRHVTAVCFAIVALSLLMYATIYEGWQVLYVLPVFALGFGGSIPVRPAFQAEYFGLKAFGAIQGLTFTIGTLGGLLGPVFAGWMYDMTESYRLAFVALSVGSFLAVPLVLSVRSAVPTDEQSLVPDAIA